MRTISDALRAAATAWGGRPRLMAHLANKRWRWESLIWDDSSTAWTDQVALATGVILRAATIGATFYTARVVDPTESAQWTDWTECAAGVTSGSDCALSVNAAGVARAFYIAPTHKVYLRSSSDGGQSWSAASLLLTTSIATHLAAAKDYLFYIDGAPPALCCHTDVGGAWAAGPTCATLPTFVQAYGLAALWDAAQARYLLAIAADGRLFMLSFAPGTGVWSAPIQLAPGGATAPATHLTCRAPSLALADPEGVDEPWYTLSYSEMYDDGGNVWENVIALRSRDGEHWGDEVALYIWGDAPGRRAALAWRAQEHALYAANERCVTVWPAYQPQAERFTHASARLLSYERHTTRQGSTVRVALLDDGTYAQAGVRGSANECIQPLSTLQVARGYDLGADGVEAVHTDPHYITRVTLTRGQGSHTLTIEARDGWGLLELWQPHDPCLWEDKTIRWLLAEVVGRVGLAYADSGHAIYEQTLPSLLWSPGQSAASLARALLALAGSVARFDEDGAFLALPLAYYAPLEHLDLGAQGETLQASYVAESPSPTSPRVVGDGVLTGLDAVSECMRLGLRIKRFTSDLRAHTADIASAMQVYQQSWGSAQARRETLRAPLRPEAELWDLADVMGEPQIIPPDACRRRIHEIHESWDAASGRAFSTLVLRGS